MSSRAEAAAKKKADKAARMARERQCLEEGSAQATIDREAREAAAKDNSWATSSGREGGPQGYQMGDEIRTVLHTVGTEGRKIESTKTALMAGGSLIGKGIEGGAWLVGASASTAGAVIQKVTTQGEQRGKKVARPGQLSQNAAYVAGTVADKASFVTEKVVNTTQAVVTTVGGTVADTISSTGTFEMMGEGESSAVTQWVGDVVEGASEGMKSIKGSTTKGIDTVATEGKAAAVGVAQHAYGRKVAREVGKTADGVTAVGKSGLEISKVATSGLELVKDIAQETATQLNEKQQAAEATAAGAEGLDTEQVADGAPSEV